MNGTRSYPLQLKIAALVLGALAILATAAGVANYWYMRGALQREATSRGKAIAETLAQSIVEMPDASLASTVAAVRKDANLAYIEIIGQGGAVLAHTFGDRPRLADELVLSDAQTIRKTVIDGKTYIDVPAQVVTGSVIHVGVDPALADQAALEAQKLLVAITLAALIVAAVAAIVVAARFVRPLRDLGVAAQRIVDGDLTHEIEITSSDETGELALAFAQMQEKLKEALRALQESVQLLTVAGTELTISTDEQSQTITRQATALQETQVTAQEIKQTSLLAAQKADAVLQLTEKAD
ncbi:MAG TPA: HAMP domain-containing protein, partial [Myxococcales bacterium]